MRERMNIGEAAAASGLPAKTIRHYEEIGLIAPAREANGYRRFGAAEVAVLAFLARARGLGFSIDACRRLLALFADERAPGADRRAEASARLEEVDRRLEELTSLRAALAGLAEGRATSGPTFGPAEGAGAPGRWRAAAE